MLAIFIEGVVYVTLNIWSPQQVSKRSVNQLLVGRKLSCALPSFTDWNLVYIGPSASWTPLQRLVNFREFDCPIGWVVFEEIQACQGASGGGIFREPFLVFLYTTRRFKLLPRSSLVASWDSPFVNQDRNTTVNNDDQVLDKQWHRS